MPSPNCMGIDDFLGAWKQLDGSWICRTDTIADAQADRWQRLPVSVGQFLRMAVRISHLLDEHSVNDTSLGTLYSSINTTPPTELDQRSTHDSCSYLIFILIIMTDTVGDMEPKGLLNADGTYVLRREDIYSLMKYVWTGVLLPTTMEDYKTRLALSDYGYNKLSSDLSSLIDAYKVTQGQCKEFKDTTYPSIVVLADGVYNYAQNAGGGEADSYYANIFKFITDLAKETDPQKQADLKKNINTLVDTQVAAIGTLQQNAANVVQSLKTFEENTKKSQDNLKTRHADVEAKLTSANGEITTLQAKIDTQVNEIRQDDEEYEHDVIVAATSATYAWVPFVGTISAIVVAGIYGHKAVEMKATIDALKDLVTNEREELAGDVKLVADMKVIDHDLGDFISLIQPAIVAIEGMIGIWDAIANDLKSLQTLADNDVRKASAALANIVWSKVIRRWNTLGEAVDSYRKMAYVTDVETKTLEQISDELGHAQ
ncbi:Pesticidal crystal protein cry6Aa [Grifola frondosa]|uniref:Pesticidal crystal protein cry6Aa n=1 Tax=Grifola frondosa TaxID=5627 RepID=A0A1C7MQ73_GRIFR|nr:Pesticidal crystal protein cry6Aa [Grifola frondosa]